MLLMRDGFGGLGVFGAGSDPYKPKDLTPTPYVPKPTNTPYVPQQVVPGAHGWTTTQLKIEEVGAGIVANPGLKQEMGGWRGKWASEQLHLARALEPSLPPCPPTAVVGGSCYSGNTTNLNPPGTFEIYGVSFNVSEFRKGERFSFQKTIYPDVLQREIIESFIRKRSAQVFGKMLAQYMASHLSAAASGGPSIKQAMAYVPQFRTEIRGLKYNPISPRDAELNQAGGLTRWFDRGGFPLIEGVARGTISLDEAISPSFCMSILCRCPVSNPNYTAVSCVMGRVTKNGTVAQHPGSDTASFWVFFDVAPSNGQITISLDYDEPSKLEKFGNAMASVFKAIGDALCVAAPIAKEQFTNLTLPKCLDKANKSCKQGSSTDCKCVAPPDSTAVAVGVTNAAMGKWCDGWNKEFAPVTDFPVDILPPAQPKPLPWAWIIGGLAVAGGLMYAARR